MEIIVLGMHRSGTSMITRLLNLAGAYFGPDHLHTGSNEENPKGFWERTDIRALNDALLHDADADWDRPVRFANHEPRQAFLEDWNGKASRILEDCHQHSCCVIKEPRMGLTLPFWRPHFQRPAMVWIQRHPLEVALSLQRRNGFPFAFGLALWEWYTVQIGSLVRHEHPIIVQHAPFMRHPEAQLEALVGHLVQLGAKGLQMPTSQKVLDFVDPSLQRAHREQAEAHRLPEPIQHLWDQLSKPNSDWNTTQTPVSSESLTLLQIADATSPPILKRLGHSQYQNSRLLAQNQRLEAQATHWQKKSEINAQNYERMKSKLKKNLDEKGVLHKRLIELEQAWANLKTSKLWQLGLAAHRIRKVLGLAKEDNAPTKEEIQPAGTLENASLALRAGITVIVPIFNAMAEVQGSLQSLLANTRFPHRLLLIDDASTQPGLLEHLESFAVNHRHVELIHHDLNAGYTATINEGILWAGEDDVVLLNSDTLVPPRWLSRLQQSAYFKANTATVTPLSNAAGAFSVPRNNQVNTLPSGWDVTSFANLVETLSPKLKPEVPTGNGFCLYIRRQALDVAGNFDTEAFPRGYGEENDFCMRASENGFCHLIDDSSFVFHHRSASFGEEKKALMVHSRTVLASRWPAYKPAVAAWLENDPLDPFRQRLTEALEHTEPTSIKVQPPPNAVLYLLHDGGGGTRLTSHHLMRALPQTFTSFLLVTGRKQWQLFAQHGDSLNAIETWDFDETWALDQGLSDEQAMLLEKICTHYGIQLAHIRHFLGNAPETISLLRGRGIPVVLSFHDFYSVCPTIQLLDRTGHFCGGDCHANDHFPAKREFHAEADPSDCTLAGNWFQAAPTIRNQYIHTWRDRIGSALSMIHAAVTTSEAAKAVLIENYPVLGNTRFEIIEHGRDFSETPNLAQGPGNDPVNLICFGALGHSKGLNIIDRLADLDHEKGRFNFHLLGNVSSDWISPSPAVKIHGPYDNKRLFEHLSPLAPSIVLIPSLWPETYCHTLTEAWVAGLPVLASDIGTLRERIQRHGGGWLANPNDPDSWYRLLLKICSDPKDYQARVEEAKAYRPVTIAGMASRYAGLYRQLLDLSDDAIDVPKPTSH